MAWNDPNLAAYHEQSASQAPMGGSSNFGSLQRPVPWNSIQVADVPVDEKSRMAMAGPTSQNAFISSTPALSEFSSCGTLVTTTWASDGTLLTQITPRLGSDSTSQELSPEASTDPGGYSGKGNLHQSTSNMNNTVASIQQGTLSAPFMEGDMSGRAESSAGTRSRDESNRMVLDTNPIPLEQTSWLGDTESIVPNEYSSSRATKSREDSNDPRDSGTDGCSQTQKRPMQAHRARNRKAATKCRAKAKAAKSELEDTEREMETRHQELSAQASSLQSEVLALKNELLMHGNCDCEVIQQYLSTAARNLIHNGMA